MRLCILSAVSTALAGCPSLARTGRTATDIVTTRRALQPRHPFDASKIFTP